MKYSQIDLGKQITKYREINNMSQKSLAEKIELSQSYIARIEKGVGESIGIEPLSRIADVLNVSLDTLLVDSLENYYIEEFSRDTVEKKNILKLLSEFTPNQLKAYNQLLDGFIEYKNKIND